MRRGGEPRGELPGHASGQDASMVDHPLRIILSAAGLGFLGLGAQPPQPEWGAMISDGRTYILDHWWVAAMPGLAIFLVSLAFNFLGDGLRDVLDPKQR